MNTGESAWPCGDVAIRKLGEVWVCHYHWRKYADIKHVELSTGFVDCLPLTNGWHWHD